MKTAGELLQEKRELKELSLEDIAKKIKIKTIYLQALEQSDFQKLPSATVIKGYLRNYAKVLHLNPDTVVAMFRRDFKQNESGEIIPRGLVEPVSGKPKLINANLILLTLSILAFILFLGFQLFTWLSLPKLNLLQPLDNEVYGQKITVRGSTEAGVTLTINQQPVLIDQNNSFSLDLIFPAGTHSVIVEAKNRQGKTKIIKRTFQVSQ